MRNAWKWIGGASIGLLLAGAVLAQQTIAPRSLTGNESWEAAAGPGGQGFFITSAQVRNSQGVITTSQTTGTLTPALTNATASLVSTAASVSLTVQLPPLPPDGQIFEWVNGSGSPFTAGTVAVTDGSTIVNGTAAGALAAGASIEYRYVQSTNSWYKIR